MKKKTVVEWLEQQLGSKIADANIRISAPKFYELINKAKEMEKQQIIDAWIDGDARICETKSIPHAEQYYQEKFKSE